jgi:hypothetical protein
MLLSDFRYSRQWWTLMMEAVYVYETSVYLYDATWHNIPEGYNLQTRRRENLKSHLENLYGETTLRCIRRFEAHRPDDGSTINYVTSLHSYEVIRLNSPQGLPTTCFCACVGWYAHSVIFNPLKPTGNYVYQLSGNYITSYLNSLYNAVVWIYGFCTVLTLNSYYFHTQH